MEKILNLLKRLVIDVCKRAIIFFVSFFWIADFSSLLAVGLIAYFVVPHSYYDFMFGLFDGKGGWSYKKSKDNNQIEIDKEKPYGLDMDNFS